MTNGSHITTIRIKKTTRDLIDSCGFRGESFDDIIDRVFQEYSRTHDKVAMKVKS
jgi:hypothetical protein